MLKATTERKTFNMQMSKDLWMFLKGTSATQERSMTEIVVTCLERYRKRLEGKSVPDEVV